MTDRAHSNQELVFSAVQRQSKVTQWPADDSDVGIESLPLSGFLSDLLQLHHLLMWMCSQPKWKYTDLHIYFLICLYGPKTVSQ